MLDHTVCEALWWGKKTLMENGIDSADLDAELLLCKIGKVSREELYCHPERLINESAYFEYEKLIARRKHHEPIAYLTGEREFYNLNLEVDPDVLIPRPETEELVDRALDFIRDYNGKNLTITDIGTGSGAISLAIMKSLVKWEKECNFDITKIQVVAIDKSEKAIAKAMVNAEKNNLQDKIHFEVGDLLNDFDGRVDLLVANLPYLDPVNRNTFSLELDYEPAMALYAGDNGMDLYIRLAKQLDDKKIKPKKIILECLESQTDELEKLFGEDVDLIVVD